MSSPSSPESKSAELKRKLAEFTQQADERERESKPSTCTSDFWIYAENETERNSQRSNGLAGKWMIFRRFPEMDSVWNIIKNAVEEGELGQGAKVATRVGKEDEIKSVICVYTYDHNDEEDVMRVRKKLRELGFTEKLSYKTDEATRAGIYRATGHTKICKYQS